MKEENEFEFFKKTFEQMSTDELVEYSQVCLTRAIDMVNVFIGPAENVTQEIVYGMIGALTDLRRCRVELSTRTDLVNNEQNLNMLDDYELVEDRWFNVMLTLKSESEKFKRVTKIIAE